MSENSEYLAAFKGKFVSALRWENLDSLFETLQQQASKGWYIYAVGEKPAIEKASEEQFSSFLNEVNQLLRKDHEEDYCGIVYANNLEDPDFVKIYDPNNLGVSCGYSDNPPLPGWVLSTIPPVDLQVALPPPGNRRRWWQKIFN